MVFPDADLAETMAFIQKNVGQDIEVAVILGSGLGGFADRLEESTEQAYRDIPGFPSSLVEGHHGILKAGNLKGRRVAVFAGRFHLYQNLEAKEMLLPVLAARAMGAQSLLLTCSAGAVDRSLKAGDCLVIEDQINLMGFDPLNYIPEQDRTPKFLDMKNAYHPATVKTLADRGSTIDLECRRGVLAGVRGPSYETPSEIRWLRGIGADAVSMSTIPEVIMARYFGMQVAGVARITNCPADIDPNKLSHHEVLAAAAHNFASFAQFLESAVLALP